MSPSESAKTHHWPIIYLSLEHPDHSVVRKVYVPMRVFCDFYSWLPIHYQRVPIFFIPFCLHPETPSCSLGTVFQTKGLFRASVIFSVKY